MQSEGPDPNPAQPARFQSLTMVPLQPVLSACLFQLCILCLKGKMPSLFVFFSSHWPICSRKTYFLAKSLSHSQRTNAREISTEQKTIHLQTKNSLLAQSKFISQMPLPSPMFSWHCLAEIWMQGPCARWLLQA